MFDFLNGTWHVQVPTLNSTVSIEMSLLPRDTWSLLCSVSLQNILFSA